MRTNGACLVGTEPATSQLESQYLTAAPRVPVLDMEFQLHQLTLHTEDMVGPEIHDFPLDDQLTVDFMHQMSGLLKYYSMVFLDKIQQNIH